MKILIIDRRYWMRGLGISSGLLRSFQGNQCCLGFYLKKCGISKSILLGKQTPEEVYDKYKDKIPSWLIDSDGSNSLPSMELMYNNDSDEINNEERESIIKEKFTQQGIKVIFRN